MAELPQIGAKVNPIELPGPKTYHIEGWSAMRDEKRLAILRQIALRRGRDPRIATLVIQIIREAGCQPREYVKQAAALLKWVQKNIYYVNEPDERLQEPTYTLRVRYGDCDDEAILLYALYRSVRLPAKLVISGVNRAGKKVRYVQGDPNYPPGVSWAHIYVAVGDKPYGKCNWYFAEPTMDVPFGWDVVSHSTDAMPEMNASNYAGADAAPSDVSPLVWVTLGAAAAWLLGKNA